MAKTSLHLSDWRACCPVCSHHKLFGGHVDLSYNEQKKLLHVKCRKCGAEWTADTDWKRHKKEWKEKPIPLH